MKTENYNLIEEDWIPVLMKDGSHRRVSLGEIFAHGEQIADLSMVAYERISVMRLLVCITMAALDERDLSDEPAWCTSRTKIPSAVAAYFSKWHDRFNFYGSHAFMQPDGLSVTHGGKAAKIDKVVIAFASGHNGTLFDHGATSDRREVSHADRVLAMLSYLNFSAGGQHPKCIWDGVETPVSVTASPLREKNMVHTFLCGDGLLESIWLNLITGEMAVALPNVTRGRPIWELDSLDRDIVERNVSPSALFSRLVPLSRVMKFMPDSCEIPLGYGLKYAGIPETRVVEASVRLRAAKKDIEATYVSLSIEEAPWRNLHAILAQREHHGSMLLRHVMHMSDKVFTIWSGGLLTDGKGKDIAAMEWRFTLPAVALEDMCVQAYEKCISLASQWASYNLYCAAKSYCEIMKVDGVGSTLNSARRVFWDALEKNHQRLVHVVCDDGDMAEWERIVANTARKAIERACPHQTGRQISAYVQALRKLDIKKKEETKL